MNNQVEKALELALAQIRESIISSYGEHLSNRDVNHLIDSFTIQHRFVIDKSYMMMPEGTEPEEYKKTRGKHTCSLCQRPFS